MVDPAGVDFTKTEYPEGGIDYVVTQFPESARSSRRGKFFCTLLFRESPKMKFIRKRPLLQRNDEGAYLTYAAALKDVINHRMELEGDFEEMSPGHWAAKEARPTKRARKGHFNSNL